MTVTANRLTAAAGLCAAAAGAIYAGVQIDHPPDDVAHIVTTDVPVRESAKALMCILAIVGITGMFVRCRGRLGAVGVAGFSLLAVGFAAIFAEQCSADFDAHRELFTRPDRLASAVVVGLGHDPAAPVIGDLMLRREDARAQLGVAEQARGRQAELGWVLDPAHAGHGYATEAVRELLRHCFHDLGLHRVTAHCFLDDASSRRLMERVGMRRESHAVRDSLHRSGRWLDSVGYALLDHEWSPQPGRLAPARRRQSADRRLYSRPAGGEPVE